MREEILLAQGVGLLQDDGWQHTIPKELGFELHDFVETTVTEQGTRDRAWCV
jgi:hypothetical protein